VSASRSTARGVPFGDRPGQGGDLVIGFQLQERGRRVSPVPPTFPPHERIAPHATFRDPTPHRLRRGGTELPPGGRTYIPDRVGSLGQRIAHPGWHGRRLPGPRSTSVCRGRCLRLARGGLRRRPSHRWKIATSQVDPRTVYRGGGNLRLGAHGRRNTLTPRPRTAGSRLLNGPVRIPVAHFPAARSSTLGRTLRRRCPRPGASPGALGRDVYTCPAIRADPSPAGLKRLHVQLVPVGAVEPDTHSCLTN